jgi:hypothetical protein
MLVIQRRLAFGRCLESVIAIRISVYPVNMWTPKIDSAVFMPS